MGLGKAQKQKRNLDARLAKKKAQEKKDHDTIAMMDDNINYAIERNGEMLFNGMFASGKFWKTLEGIY